VPLLYGLREALAMLREEGFDNAVARHARFAAGTRAAVKAWGLELLCADPRWNSNSLTVIKAPPGMDTTRLVRTAFAKYNLSIGLGLSSVAGKVFRIGHLGDLNEVSLLGALAGTEMALRDCGYTSFTPGAGVGAALAYFQKTSAIIPTREIAP
jgi:alanine-glyoxylate transaminase/serine-glyoxylate transaminase/serine-pyruvate transaminase